VVKLEFLKTNIKLQIPKYVSEDSTLIKDKHNKYSLTEGISEKVYNKIINQILTNLPILEEWHDSQLLKQFDNISWNKAIIELHKPDNVGKYNSNFYRRLAYDEILSTFLVHSEIRKNIKKIKKQKKIFNNSYQKKILENLNFKLTNDQEKTLIEINNDLTI